jgi:hypothetical protein
MRNVWLLPLLMAVHLASAQDNAVKSLAGCYELRVLPTRPPDLFKKPFRLPRKFSLTTQSGHPSGFAAHNLDTKVEWDVPFSSWTAKDANTLQITWSTGYVSYTIHLKRSGEEFHGKADYFDDTGGADSKEVVANMVECTPQTRN